MSFNCTACGDVDDSNKTAEEKELEAMRRSGEINNATFVQMNRPGKREKFLAEHKASKNAAVS